MGHPEIYSRQYYQKIFELEDRHWWHLGMREIAATLLRSPFDHRHYTRVLDAGCGTGGTMQWARDSLEASMVGGVDISLEALELCRSRPGLLLSQGSVPQLPFRAESFDLVICQDVLQHLPTDGSDLQALAEMHRVLRRGGSLLVRANSRLGMWQADTAPDDDYQRYTLPEIVSRVRATGFIVKRATYGNALPSIYAALKRWFQLRLSRHHHQRFYEGLRIPDRASSRFFLNWILVWILKAEAFYLSGRGRSLAFGHSTFCLGIKPPDEPSSRI